MRRNPHILVILVLLSGIALGGALSLFLFRSHKEPQYNSVGPIFVEEGKSLRDNAEGKDVESAIQSTGSPAEPPVAKHAGASPGAEPPPKVPKSEDAQPLRTDKGFFFYNGEYIAPPYEISLDVHGIFINGRLVEAAPTVPSGRPVPKADPGPFKWTPELEVKGMSESGFLNNMVDRYAYWESVYGQEQAYRFLERYLQLQPILNDAKMIAPGEFVLTTRSGKKEALRFSSGEPAPGDKSSNTASIHATLSKQCAYFVFARGRRVTMGCGSKDFADVCSVLISDEAPDTKVASLSRLFGENGAKELVANFRVTPGFRNRITERTRR